MTHDLLIAAAGLLALFAGGEILLRGAVGIARRLQISELLLGLTVVGFGTSMPELLVSLQASLAGEPEIALGNVVGSNIANILLIGGIAGLIYPASNWDVSIRRDAAVMVGASLLLLALSHGGLIGRPAALFFIAALTAYLVWSYRMSREAGGDEETAQPGSARPGLAMPLLQSAGGLVLLYLGADWLIRGAVNIATGLGISQAVIGLTLVAVGTSLPELATTIAAALRRKSDIALGNLVGSNIFNILAILGVTGLITPIPVADRFSGIDIPVMLGVAILFALLLFLARRMGRIWSLLLLGGYAAYIGLLATT